MRWVLTAVPVLGLTAAIGLPLLRYAQRERNERVAIAALEAIQAAQASVHVERGYAADLASLTAACRGAERDQAAGAVARLDEAGYRVELRAASGAATAGVGCDGRALVSDYYLAAAPRFASGSAQQAFASRSDGRLFLFYDGIAPRERDMDGGLATPVTERETFKIP